MKTYIDQIVYEGLGESIYCALENVIDKINKENFRNVVKCTVKCVYFLLALFISLMLFYFTV